MTTTDVEHLGTSDIPIDKLAPHPDNPNNGSVEDIARSLEQFGQYRAVVARDDGTILAGHHVVQAAKSLGWNTVRVETVKCDEATAKRILVADNRLAELGDGIDPTQLLEILDQGLDLTGTGYTDKDLADLHDLLDDDMWDGPSGDNGHHSDEDDAKFHPRINLQVDTATFDAWRRLLDQYDGKNDVDKLAAHLADQGVLS